jgi:hypothetical protein
MWFAGAYLIAQNTLGEYSGVSYVSNGINNPSHVEIYNSVGKQVRIPIPYVLESAVFRDQMLYATAYGHSGILRSA